MPLDVYEKHPIALAREKARAEARAAAHDEAQDYCRICRGEAAPDQPLYYPCKCSGSIKFVHQECLMEWLSHSQKKYCELCKTSFRFTKIYDRSMPATLPFPLFLRQVARHAVKGVSRWVRYLAVGFIWLGCLPWCIRQVWRGLFWLADGGWLNEKDVHTATQAAANMTSTWAGVHSPESVAVNFTVPEYLERIKLVFPPMQVSLADIARVLFSQGIIGRFLQFIFSLFMPHPGQHAGTTGGSNASLPISMVDRHPSILSDVQFIANWSTSPAINNATIDVVEGQLICVLLVTAFILVFLIREWVINQQNLPNLPDADADAEVPPPAAPAAQDEARPMARMRPRNHRHDPEILDEGDAMMLENDQLPNAIPGLRRALTDDNILTVVAPQFERPDLPVRSHSLLTDHDSASEHAVEDAVGDSSAVTDDTGPRPFRRHSLNSSVFVQRGIEVAVSDEAADVPFQETLPAEVVHDPLYHTFSPPHDSAHLDFSGIRDLGESSSRSSEAVIGDAPMVEDAEVLDGATQESFRPRLSEDDIDSEGPALPTPDSTDADRSSANGETHGPAAVTVQDRPAPPEELTTVQKISQWLWHTDNSSNDQARTGTSNDGVLDDQEIVGDALPDAPFVPNHNREAPPPEDAAPVPLPPREVREPDLFLGVDLNDNAADDAEDLDGVLELLGMEGPIFGMIQNVIFSLFLITVTLTASVWCPYIWGKIALLVMSNPVGMLVKAPLFVLSKTADIVLDIVFFVAGLGGFVLSQPVKLMKAMSLPLFPTLSHLLDPALIEGIALDLSQKSGARLERTLSGAALQFKPDLPTFSMVSHQALKSFKASFANTVAWLLTSAPRLQQSFTTESLSFPAVLGVCGRLFRSAPGRISSFVCLTLSALRKLPRTLSSVSPPNADVMDYALVEWSTGDRILTIFLGYAFFAVAGIIFLELAHAILGLQHNERVEGYFADCLRQAGGVMKVIVIIGLEMLVFPLYCGLLLDVALLPLFSNAMLASRIAFMIRAPFTGIFIHWFIGTCYMFHFALFVSICRKIMRTGVLYFIRDPDDPNFHPVRDVLERPIPAQLGKIAFSALVYGGLVIVCLGGVVWSLDCVGGIFPIQWATAEPKLAFPVDIIFYNFMLPAILRKAEPSKKISAMYKWWFQTCARALRLTDFLFGEQREDEKYSSSKGYLWGLLGAKGETTTVRDGIYVRAPASDSVRIPKGRDVFLEVTEENDRVDGLPDPDYGIHGKKDERFTRVYLPPSFRARIAAFIVLVWLFAASTGVTLTIGPLLLGRKVTQWLSQSALPPNDLYAFTVGIHIFALVGYAIAYARPMQSLVKASFSQWLGPQLFSSIQYGLGLIYLGLYTAVILPFVLSLITELYIHIPLFTYLETRQENSTEDHKSGQPVATIFILQTWTIGLLYLRLLLRLFSHQVPPDSQPATALRAITRNGFFKPDVRLASRAFVLPTSVACFALLGVPLGYAKALILLMGIHDPDAQMRLYRMAYPAVLGLMVLWILIIVLQRQLDSWRVKIRDEVYLIGERLHNFHEPTAEGAGKGKGKEKAL